MVRVNTKSGTAEWMSVTLDRWMLPDAESCLDVALARAGVADGTDHLQFPRSMVLTQVVVEEFDIGVGEEVFITGLFAHHTGHTKNVPIVRVGNLASYPAEIIQTSFGRMDAFLIEARSIGGLSGSPVFVHFGIVRVVDGQLKMATKPKYFLAGLVHGHYDQMEGMESFSHGVRSNREAVNTGIAIVIPIGNILKFLDQMKSSAQCPPASVV